MNDRVEAHEASVAAFTIAQWQYFMKPPREVLSDGNAWQKKILEEATLDRANISKEQREEQLPFGQYWALNRIGWATSFLTRAQAIAKPARAAY